VNTTEGYYVIRLGPQGEWKPLGVYTDQGAKRRATMIANKEEVREVYVGIKRPGGGVHPLFAKYMNNSNKWVEI